MANRPNFEPSNDARLLSAELKKVGIGETITYEALSKIVARDVRNGAASALASARRKLEREERIIFGTLTRIGLKRLSDPEIVASGQSHLDRIRKSSRRAYRRLECVRDFEAMPEKERVRHNAYQTIFGALATVTKSSTVQKVEKAVSASLERLPLAKTLEVFKG